MPLIRKDKDEIPAPDTGESISKTFQMQHVEIESIENKYLPEEIVNACPIATKLFNLFETQLPSTGHIANFVATSLSSMCVNTDRQFNLVIGAPVGQGKTVMLSQFCTIPFVNFISKTTYADYMLMYCGKFIKSIGKKKPYGVKYDKRARWKSEGGIIDKSEAKDNISNRFDIVTEGESIFHQSDIGKLLQLWNALLEQGFYRGGDQYSGHYVIGSPLMPVRHGLILASTVDEFEKYVLSDTGWNSRCVLIMWNNLPEENSFIRFGVRNDLLKDKPFFPNDVKRLLGHLNNNIQVDIGIENSEVLVGIEEIENVLKSIRLEIPGIRATKDVKRIIKGFAWLNKYNKVKYEHVIFVKALINSLCRRLVMSSENSFKYKDLGSRLHFIVSLLKYLDYSNDEIKSFIKKRFLFWNNIKPIYNDEVIENAIEEIIQPVVSPFKIRKQTIL